MKSIFSNKFAWEGKTAVGAIAPPVLLPAWLYVTACDKNLKGGQMTRACLSQNTGRYRSGADRQTDGHPQIIIET